MTVRRSDRSLQLTAILLAAAALAMFSLTMVGCSDDNDSTDSTPSAATSAEADTTASSAPEVDVTFAAPGAATFSVIAGKADGPIDIEAFMPAHIRIRQGDTIEWTAHGFEGHTVTFGGDDLLNSFGDYLVPDPDNAEQVMFNPMIAYPSGAGTSFPGDGSLFSSGFIGIPEEGKYRLTFTEQGLFTYLCVVHPFTMRGTVSVDPPDAEVEAPETVAARGQADLDTFIAEADAEIASAQAEDRVADGPGGTSFHTVYVGRTTPHGQTAMFIDGALDIKAGDMVMFVNDDRNFHNVIFKGDREEFPPAYELKFPPDGQGFNVALDSESATIVDPPPEGFGPETFLSSGSMGVIQPRLTWTLRFDSPGTYSFACTIHVFAGMNGSITVSPR